AAREVRESTTNATQGIGIKEKIGILFLTVVVGIVCVSLILTTAYAAETKYQINAMIKENTAIEGEIENLNVKIQSGTSLDVIEKRATEELGMVSPSPDQFVFIAPTTKPVKDFALALKERAYN
ncbi:MAG: cell division protein FtsL, partial [Anaerovorax sp.]